MFEKLEFTLQRYDELSGLVSNPEVIADQPVWRKYMKEMGDLEDLVTAYKEYKKVREELEDAKSMLSEADSELKDLIKDEIPRLEELILSFEEKLKVLMLPKDENDDKNVFLEIRAGTGGEEAALFGSDLLRMYMRYAERRGWKTEMMDIADTGLGGIKEAVILIKGKGAYSRLKYESGAHRVQRVPETESSGRVHTSAATVAVLPEVDDVEIEIDPNDVRVDVYRSSGHGGQSVNTTDSAVRLTHVPTGLVVTCQDEKSQIKNKDKAFRVLKARLYDLKMQEQQDELSKERKNQVGTGDRSERIRTYNFPQGRVSDHRTGVTLYKLEYFLDGDLDEIIDGLIAKDQADRMQDF
ncbi:MAG: peptide chain release factor 1 [Anaerovoracaceae bacterium]